MRLVVMALALLFAGCSEHSSNTESSASQSRQTSSDAAADLVHNFQMGRNLEDIANRTAAATHTYGMAGPVKVTAEIHRLIPQYQAQWDAALAKAYTAHLSQTELRSLSEQGRSSPYFAKLQQVQGGVSDDMHTTATPIVKAFVTEALTNAMR